MSTLFDLVAPESRETPFNEVESDSIEEAFLPSQRPVHYCFRTDIRYRKVTHNNGVCALSPHFIGLFVQDKVGDTLKNIEMIHISEVQMIAHKENEFVLVKTEESNLTCTGPKTTKFAQLLYRNYYFSFSMNSPDDIVEVRSDNLSLFPDISIHASPSQRFQFAYFALSTANDLPYNHEVVRYLHNLLLSRNSIIDISQLPLDLASGIPVNQKPQLLAPKKSERKMKPVASEIVKVKQEEVQDDEEEEDEEDNKKGKKGKGKGKNNKKDKKGGKDNKKGEKDDDKEEDAEPDEKPNKKGGKEDKKAKGKGKGKEEPQDEPQDEEDVEDEKKDDKKGKKDNKKGKKDNKKKDVEEEPEELEEPSKKDDGKKNDKKGKKGKKENEEAKENGEDNEKGKKGKKGKNNKKGKKGKKGEEEPEEEEDEDDDKENDKEEENIKKAAKRSTKGNDLVPIFHSLNLMRFVSGICACNILRPDMLLSFVPLVSLNENLRIVHFENCGAVSGLKELAEAIKKCEKFSVSYWNLSYNKLEYFEAFADIIEYSKEPLLYLNLSFCDISAEATAKIFNSMATNEKMWSLRFLMYAGNDVSSKEAQDGFDAYLRVLSKHNSALECVDIGSIKEGLSKVLGIMNKYPQPIKKLILKGSEFDDESSKQLLILIQESKTLESLDLSYMSLSSESIAGIINAITMNDELDEFSLYLNGLDLNDENLLPLFRAFLHKGLNKWKALSFDDNNMIDEDLKNLIPLFLRMKKLQELSFNGNFDKSMEGIDELLARLMDVKMINSLSIAGCENKHLEDMVARLLRKMAKDPTKITKLDISFNNVGDSLISYINQILHKPNSKLSTLNIDGNNLASTDKLGTLVDAVEGCQSLVSFPFPIFDAQQIVSRADIEEKDVVIRTLSELQIGFVQAVNTHRNNANLPNDLPFPADKQIHDLVIGIAKGMHKRFKLPDMKRHSLVCEQMYVPLPFQKVGDIPREGGSIEDVDIGNMTIYETPSMGEYVIEKNTRYNDMLFTTLNPNILTVLTNQQTILPTPGFKPIKKRGTEISSSDESPEPDSISDSPPPQRKQSRKNNKSSRKNKEESSDDSEESSSSDRRQSKKNKNKKSASLTNNKKRARKSSDSDNDDSDDDDSEDNTRRKPNRKSSSKKARRQDSESDSDENPRNKKKKSFTQSKKKIQDSESDSDSDENPRNKKKKSFTQSKKKIQNSDSDSDSDEEPRKKKGNKNSKRYQQSESSDEEPKRKMNRKSSSKKITSNENSLSDDDEGETYPARRKMVNKSVISSSSSEDEKPSMKRRNTATPQRNNKKSKADNNSSSSDEVLIRRKKSAPVISASTKKARSGNRNSIHSSDSDSDDFPSRNSKKQISQKQNKSTANIKKRSDDSSESDSDKPPSTKRKISSIKPNKKANPRMVPHKHRLSSSSSSEEVKLETRQYTGDEGLDKLMDTNFLSSEVKATRNTGKASDYGGKAAPPLPKKKLRLSDSDDSHSASNMKNKNSRSSRK